MINLGYDNTQDNEDRGENDSEESLLYDIAFIGRKLNKALRKWTKNRGQMF